MDLEKIKDKESLEKESSDFIYNLIKNLKIKSVLEIGTSVGYSALRFSKVAGVTTIESNKEKIKKAKENFKNKNNIELLEGDALKIIPSLKEGYDMILIDAKKGDYLKYFNLCLELKPKLVIAHNTISHKEKMQDFIREIKKYNTRFINLGKGLSLTFWS